MADTPVSGPRAATFEQVANAAADAAERARASTVDIRIDDAAAGAGIVWNDRGLIITNAHVMNREHAIVRAVDGRLRPARLIARDPARDLAALETDAQGLNPALAADAKPLRPGQLVLAVGSPLGVSGAVAVGVVHAIDRGRDGLPSYIRTSIRLAPGNSGGPLADAAGRVHGVNSMILNGVGVARGVATIQRFLRRASNARGTARVLGVSLQPVSLRRRGELSLGLLVTAVRERSAAARAGIRAGDVLLAVDGEPFHEIATLSDRLDVLARDEVLRLEVGRGGRAQQLSVSFADDAGQAA